MSGLQGRLVGQNVIYAISIVKNGKTKKLQQSQNYKFLSYHRSSHEDHHILVNLIQKTTIFHNRN